MISYLRLMRNNSFVDASMVHETKTNQVMSRLASKVKFRIFPGIQTYSINNIKIFESSPSMLIFLMSNTLCADIFPKF